MRTILSSALLILAATSSDAQVDLDVIEARLLPGWRTADGTHVTGLELQLAPGWKTYWRTPGDAGIPPIFDWGGSTNFQAAQVAWPVPSVFSQQGIRSVGYSGRVILPLLVTPDDGDEAIGMTGRIGLGVCEEICIPVELDVTVDLSAASTEPSPELAAALANRPLSREEARVAEVECSFRPIEDGVEVTATIDMPPIGLEEVAVLEVSDPTMWVAEPDTDREGSRLTLQTDVVPSTGQPFVLARDDVRMTIIANGLAVDIQGCS